MGGSRRARTPARPAESDHRSDSIDRVAPEDRPDRKSTSGPKGTAKDRALRLLGVRWRSREELRRRLTVAGFESDDIARALVDLEAVGLIDDHRFASEVVRDQSSRRLAGDRAIRQALHAKGVAREEVDATLAEAGDESERAAALAARQADRMTSVPTEAAHRRILGLLMRRGYGYGVALEATRRALAERAGGLGVEHVDPAAMQDLEDDPA